MSLRIASKAPRRWRVLCCSESLLNSLARPSDAVASLACCCESLLALMQPRAGHELRVRLANAAGPIMLLASQDH